MKDIQFIGMGLLTGWVLADLVRFSIGFEPVTIQIIQLFLRN